MDDFITTINPDKCIKTYSKFDKNAKTNVNSRKEPCESENLDDNPVKSDEIEKPLTSKEAVELLVNGTLNNKVCRYCLNVCPVLIELEQLMTIGSEAGLYSIAIKDMVAHIHPYKITDNPNYPNKICNTCLDKTINSYLFSQQCERAERALTNCYDDIFDKLNKLDPLERTQKRGRWKTKINHNRIHVEHDKVINYAEPTMHIVGTTPIEPYSTEIQPFECLKCAKVLPNLVSLMNHTKIHPKSMNFHCRFCAKSFPKLYQLNRHLKYSHVKENKPKNVNFECRKCGEVSENYHEFLQHNEKYKFKMVMKHVVYNKMHKLCTVCYDKGNMMSLNDAITLYGGIQELTGERTVFDLLSAVLPDVQQLTGTKICEKCYNNVISMYTYTKHITYVRNRLQTIIDSMLNTLKAEPETNICIEISKSSLLPDIAKDNPTLKEEIENQPIEILEDEFRIDSDQSEDENDTGNSANTNGLLDNEMDIKEEIHEKYIRNDSHQNDITPVDTKTSNNYDIKNEFNDIDSDIKHLDIHNQSDSKHSLPKYKDIDDIKNTSQDINKINSNLNKPDTDIKSKRYKTKYLLCFICDKKFVSDYYLKRHLLKHVSKVTYCQICNLKCHSQFQLYEHKKYVHLIRKESFECRECSRNFVDKHKLLLHELSHVNKTCVLCKKSFKNQFYLNMHIQKHFNTIKDVNYKKSCCFCEKICFNTNELSLHINKVHLNLKFNCDMCEKGFYSETNLKYHRFVHRNRCKEACTLCERIFSCRRKLALHIKRHFHTGERTDHIEKNIKSPFI